MGTATPVRRADSTAREVWPADATATLKASIARIEAILGDKTVVMLGNETSNPEGQMIEGQMIEAQMIDNRKDE